MNVILKDIAPICISLFITDSIFATQHTRGYFKQNGTYVQAHQKTDRGTNNWKDYSTKGNINPYTWSKGHKARDYSTEAWNYGSGRSIKTGVNGGQYYYNSQGRKTYVPKR